LAVGYLAGLSDASYADHIIVLAQTTFGMQKMLDKCMSEITA